MEISIIEEKENKFFNRKELKIGLRHESVATPSKAELVKLLAEKYSVDPSQVVVGFIFSKKGLAQSFAKVKILREKPKVVEKVAEKPAEKGEGEEKTEAQAGATA